MKKISLMFLILPGVFGCAKNNYTKFQYTTATNPWIDAFKDQVFFSALKESYNDAAIFELIEKKDIYNPYDGLTPDNIALAQSLGKKLIQNMPAPVMCEDCKNGQNYYMATSLHYYKSSELDSIAMAEYKKYKGN